MCKNAKTRGRTEILLINSGKSQGFTRKKYYNNKENMCNKQWITMSLIDIERKEEEKKDLFSGT